MHRRLVGVRFLQVVYVDLLRTTSPSVHLSFVSIAGMALSIRNRITASS
jgi:hypothetical protein